MASAIEPAVARLMGDTPVKPMETPDADGCKHGEGCAI